MIKKVLLTATVQSHICQFHKPLMKMLKENGYEVHVAARDNLAEKNGLQMEYADKVFDVPFERSPYSRQNFQAYKALKKIICENEYSVIHGNTPVGGIVTRLAAKSQRKRGTQVFYTAHGFHFYSGAPIKNWIIFYPLEKIMANYTDKLITITDEDYKRACKSFNCNVYRIHGVGADSKRFFAVSDENKAEIKNSFVKYDSKIILNVGELNNNKNQSTAIHSMKIITEFFPDCKLLIAGNGENYDFLLQLIESLGLDNNVELIGYTTEIDKYMKICDMLITCSFREGLPMNVIEALLCGKPVVASDNRGHRELIKNGKNGYIVKPDDCCAFAEKALLVLEDSDKYFDYAVESAEPFKDINVIEELKAIYSI